ncbi:MAG: hypothetical protein MZV64_64580 [Ignavibacteriales bacterium]|nr:hypothetical protein [Ignavibacteriales bacterium]
MQDATRVQGELVVVGGSSPSHSETRSAWRFPTPWASSPGCRSPGARRSSLGRIRRFCAGAAAGYLVGANPRNWPHDEDALVLRGIGTGTPGAPSVRHRGAA